MEQQTVIIKNFSRIENPDIHFRRMTYPPEREVLIFGIVAVTTFHRLTIHSKKNSSEKTSTLYANLLKNTLFSAEK